MRDFFENSREMTVSGGNISQNKQYYPNDSQWKYNRGRMSPTREHKKTYFVNFYCKN